MSGNAFLKDAGSHPEMTTAINSQTGAFSFDVSGRNAPFMLRAGSLYSMSGGAGTANINPLSTLMVSEMGGFSNMSSLNAFYNNPNATTMQSMFNNMSTARLHVRQKMGPLLSTYGVSNADPIMGSYPIGQGMDKMFDDVKMTIDAGGNVTMMYSNGTPVYSGPMGNIMSGTMMTGNIQSPGTGGTSTVTVSPASVKLQPGQTQQFSSNIAVTWSVATTNGGSISSTGLYTAPLQPGMYLVRGTSTTDTTQSAVATVMVGNSGMMM